MGLTLIKNVHCYTPENVGKKDILIGSEEIIAMDDQIDIQFTDMKVIDGTGKIALPGFIDNHVHIIGGGGEDGFSSRTPELHISDAIQAGVTTVIGVIGTDGTTRLMASLIAKARGLEEQGMTAFVHTGNYQVPVRTCTGSIIGSGEIAISDHRSSQPTMNELAKIASETRVGGMLGGKGGVVNIHVGDGKNGLHLLRQIVNETEIPITHFLPTHINRNPSLFQEGIDYALAGGYVDFTTSTTPEFIEEGEVPAAKAVKTMLGAGVSIDAMTMSS